MRLCESPIERLIAHVASVASSGQLWQQRLRHGRVLRLTSGSRASSGQLGPIRELEPPGMLGPTRRHIDCKESNMAERLWESVSCEAQSWSIGATLKGEGRPSSSISGEPGTLRFEVGSTCPVLSERSTCPV